LNSIYQSTCFDLPIKGQVFQVTFDSSFYLYFQTFLKNWIEKGNEQQIDDILVIGLKINPL
jgi:hypothetical protein